MKTIFLTLILTFSTWAQASDFDPYHWTPGVHLFAGGGVNSSAYANNTDTYDGGLGLNIKTDVTYFINENWAIEASSSVKFNRVEDYLIWDTLFTVGVRTTLPSFFNYQYGQPYARAFVGRSPTVMFLNGNDNPIKSGNKEASRIQFDGPVGGLAIGSLHQDRKGLVWFTELGASVQSLEQQDEVKMDGDVPVIVSSESVDGHSTIYSIYMTIGIMAF